MPVHGISRKMVLRKVRQGASSFFCEIFAHIWWFFKVERTTKAQLNFEKSSNFEEKMKKNPSSILCSFNFSDYTEGQKTNSWNQINLFDEFFFTKFYFLQFQKWPKINFWTGKKLKTAKNAISRKKIFWFIWFHEFYCLDFFKFSVLSRHILNQKGAKKILVMSKLVKNIKKFHKLPIYYFVPPFWYCSNTKINFAGAARKRASPNFFLNDFIYIWLNYPTI